MNEIEEIEAGEVGQESEAVEQAETGSLLQELGISELNIADEGVETPEDPEEEVDDRRWYVIHCYSGYEKKVKHNLEQRIESMNMQDMIFQVIVPTEEEIEVRDGKRRTVERRVFPGYVLVQMIMTDESWYVVRNTPGVTQIIDTPLRPEEMQSIQKRMEAGAPKIKVTFRPGQKVRIMDGPFVDFIGSVDEVNMEKGKVRVLVSFFGRETPVELDFLQVEKT
jgi:transcriptional antiterminator NusG